MKPEIVPTDVTAPLGDQRQKRDSSIRLTAYTGVEPATDTRQFLTETVSVSIETPEVDRRSEELVARASAIGQKREKALGTKAPLGALEAAMKAWGRRVARGG